MPIVRQLTERSPESRAARRATEDLARSVYEKGRLRVDFDAYEVWADGRPVHLMRREFELLRFLVRSANRVFDRTQILAHVWPEAQVNPRTVDVHVYRLRRCIERDPIHPEVLVTVRGVGWRFDERSLLDEPHGTTGAHHDHSPYQSRSHGSC